MEYIEPNSERWLSLEDLPSERWVNIKGYEGLYQISDYGRIKRLHKVIKNKSYDTIIMHNLYDNKGYANINLSRNNISQKFRVNRLVAQAFIPNPENKQQVNHLNGVKNDNFYKNLEWATNQENVKHSYDTGLHINKRGGEHKLAKKINQYTLDGRLIKTWDSGIDIQNQLHYCYSCIWYCCTSRRKSAYGFKWKYAKEEDNE